MIINGKIKDVDFIWNYNYVNLLLIILFIYFVNIV